MGMSSASGSTCLMLNRFNGFCTKTFNLLLINFCIHEIYGLGMWHVWVRRGGVYRVLVGKPEGKNHWGDLGVDGWIILGWISRRWDVGIWTGLGWARIETGGGRL